MDSVRIITPSSVFTTWQELGDAAANGYLDEILQEGDIIPVTLKNGYVVRFITTQDGQGKFFFVMEDCYPELHQMNDSDINAGGWAHSKMNEWLNHDVLQQFPEELAGIIADTEISYRRAENDAGIIRCQSKLFLFSETQVFGVGLWTTYEPNDLLLNLFKRRRNRIKEFDSSATFWWLRSAYASDASYFRYVNYYGNDNYNIASSSYGVALGFCIQS